MTSDLVRRWAEAILGQVGAPPDAALTVTERLEAGTTGAASASETAMESVWDEEGGALPDTGAEAASPASGPADIAATLTFADGSAVSVEFAAGTSGTDAVVLLADRLQEAVLEETGGIPRPPCPGHDHPAVAAEVNGVPSWTCPHGMGRTTRPILRDAG
ncbi:hypothetical protein ABZY93_14280 [Streptomyces smyrnaeus]|uniref:hypothetical protein n=1 Tax=Streptomyces smyrnaeus TaxID=1387713 RepID=UPI0033A318EF